MTGITGITGNAPPPLSAQLCHCSSRALQIKQEPASRSDARFDSDRGTGPRSWRSLAHPTRKNAVLASLPGSDYSGLKRLVFTTELNHELFQRSEPPASHPA